MAVYGLKDAVERESLVTRQAETFLSLAASNPDASAEILELLASSDSTEIRCLVAKHVNTPSVVLDTLMHDTASVRAALAHNPKAIERVWSLASDRNPKVRLNLAENPNLPDHVYQALAKDPDLRVARSARCTLSKLRQEDSPVASLFRLFSQVS